MGFYPQNDNSTCIFPALFPKFTFLKRLKLSTYIETLASMKIFKFSLLFLFLAGMTAQAQVNIDYNQFIPVGPAPIDYKIFDGRLFSELSLDEANNEQVINLLPNELMAKSIIVMDDDRKLTLTPVELSEKNNTYIVRFDYIKYTTLPVRKDNNLGDIVGIARVGVGMRIEATLRAKAKDVNVTDLFALGLAARDGDIKGNLVGSIMGIESEEVTAVFPVNAEITPTSIQTALQALAVVKGAIYDKDTHLTPQVLQIKYTQEYTDQAAGLGELTMPIMKDNEGDACVVVR